MNEILGRDKHTKPLKHLEWLTVWQGDWEYGRLGGEACAGLLLYAFSFSKLERDAKMHDREYLEFLLDVRLVSRRLASATIVDNQLVRWISALVFQAPGLQVTRLDAQCCR